MIWSGSTSVPANDLRVSAIGCPSNQFGISLYGAGNAQVPFGNGYRRVSPGGAYSNLSDALEVEFRL